MADIISIADFFINRPENFTMVVAAAAVLVSFIVAITEYKSNLLAYITNRRNKWWFVYFLLSGVALLFLWRHYFQSICSYSFGNSVEHVHNLLFSFLKTQGLYSLL